MAQSAAVASTTNAPSFESAPLFVIEVFALDVLSWPSCTGAPSAAVADLPADWKRPSPRLRRLRQFDAAETPILAVEQLRPTRQQHLARLREEGLVRHVVRSRVLRTLPVDGPGVLDVVEPPATSENH